jgi:hypothetical protein
MGKLGGTTSIIGSYLWPIIVWILGTNIAIAFYNYIAGYVFMMAILGFGCSLGFDARYYRKIFPMICFAKREQLKSAKFFDASNLQHGGIAAYPKTPQEYLNQADDAFKTALALSSVLFLSAISSTILSLLPDSRYLLKSSFYMMLTMFNLLVFTELMSITLFDLVNIEKPLEQEENEQRDPREVLVNPALNRNPIGANVPLMAVHEPQIIIRDIREAEEPRRRAPNRPRRPLRLGGVGDNRPVEIRPRIDPNINNYPKRQNSKPPNNLSMRWADFAAFFATYIILKITGFIGASIVRYLLGW